MLCKVNQYDCFLTVGAFSRSTAPSQTKISSIITSPSFLFLREATHKKPNSRMVLEWSSLHSRNKSLCVCAYPKFCLWTRNKRARVCARVFFPLSISSARPWRETEIVTTPCVRFFFTLFLFFFWCGGWGTFFVDCSKIFWDLNKLASTSISFLVPLCLPHVSDTAKLSARIQHVELPRFGAFLFSRLWSVKKY